MVTAYHTTFALHELYYAVLNASRRLAREMPRVMIPQGTLVLRSIDSTYDNKLSDERTARTIFAGRVNGTQRWSGAQPGGRREPGRGGLDVSLCKPALLEEALQYSRGEARAKNRPRVGRSELEIAMRAAFDEEPQGDKVLFVFELQRTLSAVDLSESLAERFCARLNSEVDVRHELDEVGFEDLTSALRTLRDDNSITRALGNAALMACGVEAIVVTSSRDDVTHLRGASDPRARTAVLAGFDEAPLTYLRPMFRLAYEQFGSVIQLQRKLAI
jgi:hypothetical protein